eukprot:TRINITY_DN12192_c0_g1_i1.p1 TRINITY_DN12192_c0_g1~~TRINITY_DN12192_c0_g1_i1.p1  ORF type:complete len:313 (+),score=142.17 TRINITY_DN12192_c0_g1_i1:66-1004(+)
MGGKKSKPQEEKGDEAPLMRNAADTPAGDADDKPVKGPPKIPITETPCSSITLPAMGDVVVLKKNGNKVEYLVDGKMRCPDVKKMYFDPYWGFLRFPDLGRGGKLLRDAALPPALGQIKGLVKGTDCKLWMPNEISVETDIPLGLQRGQLVKAMEDIFVGEGTLAVQRGTLGRVVGVVESKQPFQKNVPGSGQPRINVKWDERVDGKTKKISILPEEGKTVTDLPPGGWLRGARVLRMEEDSVITPDAAIIVGPPRIGNPVKELVRVWWEKTDKEEDVDIETLHLVSNYCFRKQEAKQQLGVQTVKDLRANK